MEEAGPLPLPDPPLSGGRVALRPWAPFDARALTLAGSDPTLRRFRASHPATEHEVRDWLAGVEPARVRGDRLELAVTDAVGECVLGSVTLWAVHRRYRSAMATYWVAADARGRGVATCALRLLADWSFDSLDLARLQLFIDPENVR